ncbi:hypothetical protein LF95_18530 [Thalassospira sp. TSL5-1]|nr:hypothetical protein LF95_18530 [Thalassospira sp. TSL5-1]
MRLEQRNLLQFARVPTKTYSGDFYRRFFLACNLAENSSYPAFIVSAFLCHPSAGCVIAHT